MSAGDIAKRESLASHQAQKVAPASERAINVLFLCTGNSARSIMAESLLNHLGGDRFRAFSAGSHPSGKLNPLVMAFLRAKGLPNRAARSKCWDEFAAPGAPLMDLVITVCDQAAGEACPVWPGHPARAHWSAPDPAPHMDDQVKASQVIRDAFRLMHRRVSLLISLPVERFDRVHLACEAKSIARETVADAPAKGTSRSTS